MKKLFFYAFLLLSPLSILAQTTWSVGVPSLNFGKECVTTADGGVATYTTNPNRVIKVDPDGTVLWVKSLDDPDIWLISSITQTSDRAIVILALTTDQQSTLVFKFDEFGQLLWQKGITFPNSGLQSNWLCRTPDDGGVLLGGGECNLHRYAIRLDGQGNEVWLKQFDNLGTLLTGFFWKVVPATGGGYFAAYSRLSIPDLDWGILKFDENGAPIWAKTIDEGSERDEVAAMIPTSNGGMAILGTTENRLPAGHKTTLTTMDAQGNLLAYTVYDDSTTFTPHSLVQTSDGGFMFTGISSNVLMMLVKTDALGNIQWQVEGNAATNMMGGGLSLAPNGMVYATGFDLNVGYFVAKLNGSTGQGLCSTVPLNMNATSHSLVFETPSPTVLNGTVIYAPTTYVPNPVLDGATMLCTTVGSDHVVAPTLAKCGPNPCIGRLHIDLGQVPSEPVVLRISDIYGRVLAQRDLAPQVQVLDWDLPKLPSGLIFLNIVIGTMRQSISVMNVN